MTQPHAPLHGLLQAAMARHPDKTALVCGARRLSYAELGREVAAVAQALQAQAGIGPGERVALMLDNSVEMAAGLFATWQLGAVCVTLNPLTRTDKLRALLASTRAAALLTQGSLAAVWQPAAARAHHLRGVWVTGADGADGDAPPRHAWPAPSDTDAALPLATGNDTALALISHTSGTTGAPKGVMLSHGNLGSAIDAIRTYLRLDGSDVIASALPLSFNYGLTQLLLSVAEGATLVLERNFAFPVRVLETLARERATVFPGVPTMYAMLTALSGRERHDLSSLRLLTNAAATLPAPVIDRLRAWLPQARLYAMYGQTECTRISYLPPDELDRRPGSVGRGIPGQTWWRIDEAGRRLPPDAFDVPGELVVQGPHVMQGYWEQPEQTARKLRPDDRTGALALHTGDLFREDADGYLYFVARQDDIIKSRGEKVSPREVEDAIMQLDAVLECAVAGVPDELLGQAVKAWVVLREGRELPERELIRHCMGVLESYMVPRQVAFVASLPKTDTGKLRRRDLG